MPIVQFLGARRRMPCRARANRCPAGILFGPVGSCPAGPVKQATGRRRIRSGLIQAARSWRKCGVVDGPSGQAVCRMERAIRCIAARPELWFERPGFPPVPPHRKTCHARGKTPCSAGPSRHLACGGRQKGASSKAEFLVEGAHRTMLVLKRLIAFVVTGVTVVAAGGVALGRPRPALALGTRAADVGDAGHGRHRLVP